MTPLADASTEAVLGASALLAALDPDSAQAREAARALRAFGPADLTAWQAEICACQAAERWLLDHPDAHKAARDALSQLPALDTPARRLRAGEPLGEGELFTVKRAVYFGWQAAREALALLVAWHQQAASWPDQLAALMAAIHPEPAPSPRFHLAAELDPSLPPLRKRAQEARRSLRELRQPREAALRADYGVAFDFEGALRLPPALSARAAHDTRLRPRREAWELADAAVDAAEQDSAAHEAACRDAEQALLVRLSERVTTALDDLLSIHSALIALDLRLARARLKLRIEGCWPQWRPQGQPTQMSAALDPRLKSHNAGAQPIDLEAGAAPVIITGPNMGGKSSALKLVGLCQWAMQRALPAPARAFASPPVAQIIYVGSDEPGAEAQSFGLSSFGREVQRLVSALAGAPKPRLWLLDEIGRGTHPDEGAALARRLIERLVAGGDRVLAATHFPAVAAMPSAARWRVAGLDRALIDAARADGQPLDAEQLARLLTRAMDYRLLRVEAGDEDVPRDARLVAQLLGLELP